MSSSDDDSDSSRSEAKSPCLQNDGYSALEVPGFNGVSPCFQLSLDNRFSHGFNDWSLEINLTARELAMLQLMAHVVEQKDWHTKILDPLQTLMMLQSKKIQTNLISPAASRWCIAELKDKAKYYTETKRVVLLNTGSGVCVSAHASLSILTRRFRDEARSLTTWRKYRDGEPAMIQHLVDPSLYPLHYEKTKVLVEGGRVELLDVMSSWGSGVRRQQSHWQRWRTLYGITEEDENWQDDEDDYSIEVDNRTRFSSMVQWLPCEVQFVVKGKTAVRITSYINNICPTTHGSLYRAVEDLLPIAIESWNEILVKGGKGRWPRRIKTYGIQWAPDAGKIERENLGDPSEDVSADNNDADNDNKIDNETNPEPGGRPWVHPEPGQSFSYNQWKLGHTHKSIIEPFQAKPASPTSANHQFYQIKLQDSFHATGLQVVIEIKTIRLTSKRPKYPSQAWQIGGALNDHIVAVAVLPFSSANVSEAQISFRQETQLPSHSTVHDCQNCKIVLGTTFGVTDVEDVVFEPYDPDNRAIQKLGSVELRNGRLVAWPTTLHHREESFELVDKTKPGHRSYIKLWLVDPHYRLCSTRNVPPQQFEWWFIEVMPLIQLAANIHGKHLPTEVMLMIEKYVLADGQKIMKKAYRVRNVIRGEQTLCQEFSQEIGLKVYEAFT